MKLLLATIYSNYSTHLVDASGIEMRGRVHLGSGGESAYRSVQTYLSLSSLPSTISFSVIPFPFIAVHRRLIPTEAFLFHFQETMVHVVA